MKAATSNIPYQFSLHIEVGFGRRFVLIFARAEGLYGLDLISPIRSAVSETALSKEDLAGDITWGLSAVREFWGKWSTPEIDGNPALREAYDLLALRAKQPSGRAASLKLKKFGVSVEADHLELFRYQREGGGWGGVLLERIDVKDFPSITPTALKKLAAKCAAIAFPHLDGAPHFPAAKPAKRGKT
jgi:hypothetical protein